MYSVDDSEHDIMSTEMLEDTFVTEVSLIQTLFKERPVIKYVIVLGKDNRIGKDH